MAEVPESVKTQGEGTNKGIIHVVLPAMRVQCLNFWTLTISKSWAVLYPKVARSFGQIGREQSNLGLMTSDAASAVFYKILG